MAKSKGQTTQRPKEKGQKDNQMVQKTEDWAAQAQRRTESCC
jgi:hypothetical protein